MFSSLASYLFGSSSTTADTPIDTNPTTTEEEITTTENKQLEISIVKKKSKKNKKRNNKHCDKKSKNLTSDESDDDDWLFIERENEEESIPRTDSDEDHTVVEIKTPATQRNLRRQRNKNKRLQQQSPIRTSSPVRDYDAVSQSMHVVPEIDSVEPIPSANNSLVAFGETTLAIPANLSMEESWFLTPPPIFTSTGPINIELSPFENLLIEHPSMSVYHSIRSAQEATESFVNLDLGIEQPSQSNTENHHSVEEGSPENAPNAVQQRNGNRVDRLSNNQNKETILFRKSQKAHDKREKENISRGAMKRTNNVRYQLSKGGYRQRRSDLQHCKLISGSNNNRKC